MNCPYCNAEMQSGWISAENLLCWVPDEEMERYSAGATRWSKTPNSIILAEYTMFGSAKSQAFYCDTCEKLIINVDPSLSVKKKRILGA